jgi:hypothetical protein
MLGTQHSGPSREGTSSQEFEYSNGCMADMVAGLIMDPIQAIFEGIDRPEDPRWLRVRPDWESPESF